MNIQVSGRHVDLGESLKTRIVEELAAGIGKYFERGGSAEVVVSRDKYQFNVDVIVVLASGQRIVASGLGGDAHAAFDVSLTKVVTRVRRYKQRLKNHHQNPSSGSRLSEAAQYVVLRAPADDDDDLDSEWGVDGSAGAGAPAAAIIAETEASVKTMTVSMAVMELDMVEAPVVLFRHAGHGGLSVVYRRTDGNIGWIDPQRTHPAAGATLGAEKVPVNSAAGRA